ncbi:MAG: DNA recombination protein RmuC [Bacteroidales bacterium]|nr:DNA recombination protein RmuC [Bacteroidales bacterium]
MREELMKQFASNREGLEKSSRLMSDLLSERVAKMEQMQSERLQQVEKSQKEAFAVLDKTQKEAFAVLDKTQKESMELFNKGLRESLERLDKTQKESLERLDKTQNELIKKTDERLEHIRVTVEEKLDKTLADRLGKSFETVGKQLNEVQQGLGEMKTLAQDVGGLKKVLGNVKMRGGLGEIQLQMLLENILAPDQYSANVATKKGSRDVVEFAVKLPGSSDDIPNIWLPIDAKFPKDVYEKLQEAYDSGDLPAIETAQKELEAAIKLNAKDISSKYIDTPYTTNFAIMFLPFEGIYAEVVRRADLLEYLQRNYNIIVTGPTTLAAILNSLQIGFKTLAIQKRSSEVWETLGAVKSEFEKFGGILEKAKDKIQGGLNDMDSLVGVRTRAIQRKLRSVESLEAGESRNLLDMEL